MKVIIDIPEHILDTIQADEMLSREQLSVLQIHILKGTPLDSNSDRAEVRAYFDGESFGWDEGREALIEELKAKIAEEVCLTDNPYTKETKYTIEHSKLLDILDRIGKESEE